MDKRRPGYPTDVNDTEWAILEQQLPCEVRRGHHWRKWTRRELINAMFYVVRSGCAWRLLPHDLPPWQTVYSQFRRWRNDGTWQHLNAALVQAVRRRSGRRAHPSAAIVDSQSVKTLEGGQARGVDVYKRVTGRKRHIVVDTLGLLLIVIVHSASIPDQTGGQQVLGALFDWLQQTVPARWRRLRLIWADGGYKDIVQLVKRRWGWRLKLVRRPAGTKGFIHLARRWVVERTFAWLGRSRRLSKDYERCTASSEAMIYLVSIRYMLKRFA